MDSGHTVETSTTKLLEERTLTFTIYGSDFRNLVEEHEHVAEEGLSGRTHLFMVYGSLHIQIKTKANRDEIPVPGSNCMNDLARILGAVMNLGAHLRMLRSGLCFSLWYKVLASEKITE